MITNPVEDNQYWADIFDGIMVDITSPTMLPLKYVSSVSVFFHNGKDFEIPVYDLENNFNTFSDTIKEFISKYEDEVNSISYNLELDQVIDDVTLLTDTFLATYNL